MSTNTIVKVENLGKSYRTEFQGVASYDTLRDATMNQVYSLFRNKKKKSRVFWALKEINFSVKEGEVLGVIGRNGAGKSTLLKILSRITEPTTGRITLFGRVASLLEVGTGFHPELTGRENIFLSGTILGMTRHEIKREFDEIVDFSGVERFIDIPVKRFSSGMRVRLGFAVAAHLQPEVLLVDEVLAVGDAAFQKKCLGKMDEVAKKGRTILFVSHNLGAVKTLCNRCILLQNGRLAATGTPSEVINTYLRPIDPQESQNFIPLLGTISDQVSFQGIEVNKMSPERASIMISGLEEITVKMMFQSSVAKELRINLGVYHEGVRIFTLQNLTKNTRIEGQIIEARFHIPEKLLRPGVYTIGGGVLNDKTNDWAWGRDLATFEILAEWNAEILSHNFGLINVFEK